MKTQSIGKIAGSMAVTGALLLSGAGLAFAQTTNTTGTTYTSGSATGTTGSTGTLTGSTSSTGAGTTNTTGSTGSTGTTPGVPNTGAGGDAAANLAVLGVSAIVVAGGAAYLARRKYLLG